MPSRFGQNFLQDKNKLKTIAAALSIKSGDFIIEIGPGHGELTDFLIKDPKINLVVLERDENLSAKLKEKYNNLEGFEIIIGDALETLPKLIKKYSSKSKKFNYKLCGNIPYYITGHLLRLIGDLDVVPDVSVFTIQKEVGERLCAKKGQFNQLSAFVSLWGESEIIINLPKEDFRPVPKVDSVAVKMIKNIVISKKEKVKLEKTIKSAFKQPRKTLLNNLRDGLNIDRSKILEALPKLGLSENSRPQDLDINLLKKLDSFL